MMTKRIESLAWLVLWVSFGLCLLLTIGAPLTVRWYLRNATRPLTLILQPRTGTTTLKTHASALPVLVSDNTELSLHNTVMLADNADALLLFYLPNQDSVPSNATEQPATSPLLTIQLYGPTELSIEVARTPRFKSSPLAHQIDVTVRSGRNLRFSVANNERHTKVHVHTPYGQVEMNEGTYAIAIEDKLTAFSVSTGQGEVTDPQTQKAFVLTDGQRVEITDTALGEISANERNILHQRNGNFEAPLDGAGDALLAWETYGAVGIVGENSGSSRQVSLNDNQKIVSFARVGLGSAQTGLVKEINQDIRGARSVRVQARVRVDTQTLGVCGTYASECPIMLRLSFIDSKTNTEREWLQGFYVIEGANPDQPFCQICEWQVTQIRLPQLNLWYDYESPDLLPLLRAHGIEPAAIQSVRVYASGHTYESAIDEIAILVGE